MKDFRLKDYGEFDKSESGVTNGKALLSSYRDSIRKDLVSVKENYFYLGLHLLSLYDSNCYAFAYAQRSPHPRAYILSWLSIDGRSYNAAHSRFFFDYCEKEFGLVKSEVSRLINVVDEFRNETMSGFKYPYSEFGFSALCELLPLTEEQRACVGKDWTIKQIREYKRSLSGSGKSVVTYQQILNEEKSNAVATSQQVDDTEDKMEYNFRYTSISIPLHKLDYVKYGRFYAFTPQALCDKVMNLEDRYIELEQEKAALEKEVQRLKALLDIDITASNTEDVPVFNNGKISPF